MRHKGLIMPLPDPSGYADTNSPFWCVVMKELNEGWRIDNSFSDEDMDLILAFLKTKSMTKFHDIDIEELRKGP